MQVITLGELDLSLEHGSSRDPASVLAALAVAGVDVERVIVGKPWPDRLEFQATGELDFPRLVRAIRAVAATLCPEEVVVSVRIVRDQVRPDLLFGIPCDDLERAIDAVSHDIRSYQDDSDAFRSWFRGRWMGQAEEDALTAQELASAPLDPTRILEYLDPPAIRDWRPIQHYVERHAKCSQLAGAMALATTATQRWRLAYALHRRTRSCKRAIPLLIKWLEDPDRTVREEAADSVGQLILAVRHDGRRTQLGNQAGAALLAYINAYPEDNLYFARTALGATGYEPARPYLEELSRAGPGQEQESARKGLANLDDASRSRTASSGGKQR